MPERTRNPAARRAAIQRQLLLDGSVAVETLSREFGVSVATIRRDLTVLDEEGEIRRTHGGAISKAPRGADQAFALREKVDPGAKRAIARKALELFEADQTLFMNDGSTILALARELVATGMPFTVATPGINVATTLAENPEIETYLLGGRVRHRILGTSGDFTERMLRAFNGDVAFIAAEGFSPSQGLTYSYESDAKIARLMMEQSLTTVVLATARKLGQRDRITAIPAEAVDMLVTDCNDAELIDGFSNLGVTVVVADVASADSSNVQAIAANSRF